MSRETDPLEKESSDTRFQILFALGMICLIIFLAYLVWLGQDYQTKLYVPNIDDWSCEKLGKWIVDKRLHGNGFEVQAARQFADIYPIKCGVATP